MSAANATVMRPVSVFLPGRVLTETNSVTVACRGNRKKMGEKVTFIANATVFNVSDEKTDRYKGRYRSVGCHVTPVLNFFMMCYGKNADKALKLHEGQLVSFRGVEDGGNSSKFLLVHDIITDEVQVS
jgi:hypothetical protein